MPVPNLCHPALEPRRVAVVTGAARGIGLAAARRFASFGMRLCLGDLDGNALEEAGNVLVPLLPEGRADLRLVQVDVAKREGVAGLRDAALDAFGDVAVLMNNAAIGVGAGPWENSDHWRRLLDTNFFGVLYGLEAFVAPMLAHGRPAAIVNVGSKQGITTPPGNAAYNVSKAGVKVLTEQLAHELRQAAGARVTAHLLVPGYTFTAMTRGGAAPDAPKPAAAWTPDQVVDVLVSGLAAGDFYILCPDNEVTRGLDERRIQWGVDDIIRNRPALSRWHPDYAAAFHAFVAGAGGEAGEPAPALGRNVELKRRCPDLEAVRRAAVALGARDMGILRQRDTFFNAPGARLKLRDFGDGRAELISYRRPDTADARGSDYRICAVADPAALVGALSDALGVCGVVQKTRHLFLHGHTRIHLDAVEGLGTFVELETVLSGLSDSEGHLELQQVAAALALGPLEPVPRAYVDLLRRG